MYVQTLDIFDIVCIYIGLQQLPEIVQLGIKLITHVAIKMSDEESSPIKNRSLEWSIEPAMLFAKLSGIPTLTNEPAEWRNRSSLSANHRI